MATAPWNAGKSVGARRAFRIEEVRAIAQALEAYGRVMERALFMTAIDTMLRFVDLQKMRVADIYDTAGHIFPHIRVIQQKTRLPVSTTLTPHTIRALESWIAYSGQERNALLFPSPSDSQKPLSASWLRRAVKSWARMIGRSPDDYSTHSLRRSKPSYLYFECGVEVATIATLLGHKSTNATLRYLGVSESAAHEAALAGDLFSPHPPKHASRRQLSESDIDAIATRVHVKLLPFLTTDS